jgi:hypothetical protein
MGNTFKTALLLAVLTAMGSLKSGAFGSRVLLNQTRERFEKVGAFDVNLRLFLQWMRCHLPAIIERPLLGLYRRLKPPGEAPCQPRR